MLYELAILQLV